jgi:hypothetical protein
MAIEALVRANLWAERHRTLVLAVTAAAFALSCAHYARFIRLPEIVALPVVLAGLLTGLRYALWDGWLKRQVEARTRQRQCEAAAAPSARSLARAEARADRSGRRGGGEGTEEKG